MSVLSEMCLLATFICRTIYRNSLNPLGGKNPNATLHEDEAISHKKCTINAIKCIFGRFVVLFVIQISDLIWEGVFKIFHPISQKIPNGIALIPKRVMHENFYFKWIPHFLLILFSTRTMNSISQ